MMRRRWSWCLFFNDTATTEIYTLSLHDALPISNNNITMTDNEVNGGTVGIDVRAGANNGDVAKTARSEEHTSELQSRQYLVCRLLLEKKTLELSTMHSGTTPTQIGRPHV